MKRLIVLSSLLVSLTTGCSIPSNNDNINEKISYTENLDITDNEITELKNLFAKNNELETKTFNIKTLQQGKDVDVEMLLMNPKAGRRAKFWGIKTANQLLYAGATPTKRWFLERKLGGLFPSQAFKSQVMFWLVRADLLRVKNVDLNDSFLLAMAGVTSTPHLARFNNVIDQSALFVQLSLLAFQYGMPIPSSSEIASWTQDAVNHPPVLY
ncbi:MAG: hypothetical protein KatS3mg068_0634 [Candidatus Sericytochromatia bacterium]|nr:MAG: hypothetical protein KatS3mg068_0634 [Candidatus Sericytochromatia bacterium]